MADDRTRPSDEELINIADELDATATPGPWDTCRSSGCPCGIVWCMGGPHAKNLSIALVTEPDGDVHRSPSQQRIDGVFLATSRTLVPDLRDALKEALAKVKKLEAEIAEAAPGKRVIELSEPVAVEKVTKNYLAEKAEREGRSLSDVVASILDAATRDSYRP